MPATLAKRSPSPLTSATVTQKTDSQVLSALCHTESKRERERTSRRADRCKCYTCKKATHACMHQVEITHSRQMSVLVLIALLAGRRATSSRALASLRSSNTQGQALRATPASLWGSIAPPQIQRSPATPQQLADMQCICVPGVAQTRGRKLRRRYRAARRRRASVNNQLHQQVQRAPHLRCYAIMCNEPTSQILS